MSEKLYRHLAERDVILNGKIYRPVDGIVELPEIIENQDIKPIDESGSEDLNAYKKDELLEIAVQMGLDAKQAMSKAEIIELINSKKA